MRYALCLLIVAGCLALFGWVGWSTWKHPPAPQPSGAYVTDPGENYDRMKSGH